MILVFISCRFYCPLTSRARSVEIGVARDRRQRNRTQVLLLAPYAPVFPDDVALVVERESLVGARVRNGDRMFGVLARTDVEVGHGIAVVVGAETRVVVGIARAADVDARPRVVVARQQVAHVPAHVVVPAETHFETKLDAPFAAHFENPFVGHRIEEISLHVGIGLGGDDRRHAGAAAQRRDGLIPDGGVHFAQLGLGFGIVE